MLKDPTLLSIQPLHQLVATTSVIVSNLTSRAQASLSAETTLNALWTTIERNMTAVQTSLASTTIISYNSAMALVSQVLPSYNQSFASLVSISQMVFSSHSLLSTSVSNSVTQQQAAVSQLRVLMNETVVQLTSVRIKLDNANSLKQTAISRVSQSIQISSIAARNSQSYQNIISNMSSSMVTLKTSVNEAQSLGIEMQQFAVAMKANSSAANSYANQLNAVITASLPADTKVTLSQCFIFLCS